MCVSFHKFCTEVVLVHYLLEKTSVDVYVLTISNVAMR